MCVVSTVSITFCKNKIYAHNTILNNVLRTLSNNDVPFLLHYIYEQSFEMRNEFILPKGALNK